MYFVSVWEENLRYREKKYDRVGRSAICRVNSNEPHQWQLAQRADKATARKRSKVNLTLVKQSGVFHWRIAQKENR
jgi:hypothetical protein